MIQQIKCKRTRARFIKQQEAQTRKHLSTTYSVFEPAMCEDGVRVFSKNLEPVGISKRLADSIGRIEIKWSITCYILAREKNGKDKLIDFELDIETPCKHSDIKHQIADAHWKWIQEYKWQDTILTAGWIACGYGLRPTIEEAYTLFDKVGCWDELIAEWEDAAK